MALKYSDKAVDFHVFGTASVMRLVMLMLQCLRRDISK